VVGSVAQQPGQHAGLGGVERPHGVDVVDEARPEVADTGHRRAHRGEEALAPEVRQRGRAGGAPVVPQRWIDLSWTARTTSPFTGDGYGYGWFLRTVDGHAVHYAWGYGGQMLYVVPSLDLTVVMTSADDHPAARTGYRDSLNGLMARTIAALG